MNKYQIQYARKNSPRHIFFYFGVVFLQFLPRASNGCQYSNFENKCPKLGTVTPEDMVLTNLAETLDSDPSGFVVACITLLSNPI